jgi:tryptophanyl-tRNA synthetase
VGEQAKSKPAAGAKRVLSGMRPTGRLHIGHYFGALDNWVRLQNAVTPQGENEYECFYFIADWHALTTDYADTSAVAQNTLEIATDYLAAGLDPQKCVIFQQSQVPEHAELHLLLSMVTPLGWLERVPTYKEALENIKDKDLHTYGFLGYPVLQCGDIVMYGEEGVPLFVPVGEDQVSHVELSREIVRRFNAYFGLDVDMAGIDRDAEAARSIAYSLPKLGGEPYELMSEAWRRNVRLAAIEWGIPNFMDKFKKYEKYFTYEDKLTEPRTLLTKTPRIPGTDGRKMSKSYGNTITLSETDETIRAKTKVMMTDPARKRRTDRGNPEVCPVFDWHKLFSTPETIAWAVHGCRTAEIGCIECKAAMADGLIKWIAPVRARRQEYEKHPARVLEIVDEGSRKAREVAKRTMERVRNVVFRWQDNRAEVKAQ